MKPRLNSLIIVSFVVLGSCQAFAGKRLESGSISFDNQSTNVINVTDLLYGNKPSGAHCGYLGPNGGAKSVNMFPRTIPDSFQIEYRDSSDMMHTEKLDAAMVKKALDANKTAREATIYFVFSSEQKFILKLYLESGGESLELGGTLLPDEDNPAFKSYKELVRSAYDGNATLVKELLSKGTPYTWSNNPISLTPLEWSVRWNRKAAFDVLIDQLPKDFYSYDYYNCIRLAAQEGYVVTLKRLLQSDFAKELPSNPLQEIFYAACYHRKTPDTLEMLLAHFKVGVDYKVRDYGHTLLFVAVQADSPELVRWLLAQGANPNVKLQSGDTPLKWARNVEVRRLLLEHGGK